MSVFSSGGTLLEPRGPLRLVTLGGQKSSPVQLLLTNDGVAPAVIKAMHACARRARELGQEYGD